MQEFFSRRNIDKNEVKKNSIEEIDLVVVNLYPFEETVKKIMELLKRRLKI